MTQSYTEFQEELDGEQRHMSREEIKNHLQELRDEEGRKVYEHTFDPDTAPPVKHKWVDRGLKMSCEIGTHPHHEAWKH